MHSCILQALCQLNIAIHPLLFTHCYLPHSLHLPDTLVVNITRIIQADVHTRFACVREQIFVYRIPIIEQQTSYTKRRK